MNRRLTYIFAAILIVLGVVFVALAMEGDLPTENLESNLFFELTEPAEILRVRNITREKDLDFGNYSEWHRFEIRADGLYTLRYLTFEVDYAGLDLNYLSAASDWKLYPVWKGKVDFRRVVGTGIARDGKLLQMSLDPFMSSEKVHQFALVAPSFREALSEAEPSIAVSMPDPSELAPIYNWSWMPGRYEGAWIDLENSLGADKVEGLASLEDITL